MNTIDPIAKLMGEWSSQINIYSILLRIGLSVLLSAIIGCERSSKRHAAGLRTFILVSLASTVAMLLDIFICDYSYNNRKLYSFQLTKSNKRSYDLCRTLGMRNTRSFCGSGILYSNTCIFYSAYFRSCALPPIRDIPEKQIEPF